MRYSDSEDACITKGSGWAIKGDKSKKKKNNKNKSKKKKNNKNNRRK